MLMDVLSFLNSLELIDYVFFFVVVLLIILIVCLLYFINVNKDNQTVQVISNLDLNNPEDLKTLVSNIKPEKKTIALTSYEEEQEQKAIISYEELLKNKGLNSINYSSEIPGEVNVKQIDLNNIVNPKIVSEPPKIEVNLMSLQKEEEFLNQLKELQILLN